MLKKTLTAVVVALLPTAAVASVQSSVTLQINDFIITQAGGGAIIPQVAGQPAVPGANITILGASDTSALTATVNGLTSFSPNSTSLPSVGGVDALAAFSNGTSTVSPLAENTFSAAGIGSNPFAIADSGGIGNVLLGGASVTSFSAAGADNTPSVVDNASSTSNLLSTNFALQNISGGDLTIEFAFDAVLDILLTAGDPTGFLGAEAGFTVDIVSAGGGLSFDGLVNQDFFNFAPEELNTGDIATTSDLAINTGTLSFESPEITIENGALFTLTIQQTTSASVDPLPEPTALLVWGALVSCGVGTVSGRRFRKA